MAKYREIDPKFLRRYFDLLANHGREVDNKYADHNCGKEVFVRRTMGKWLRGKYFVVIQKEATGSYISTDPSNFTSYVEVKIPKKHFVQINNCSYQLGYGDKLSMYVDDVSVSKSSNNNEFSYNDFLRLQFREINGDEFESAKSLFRDDRDENEYQMLAYNRTKIIGRGKKAKYEEVIIIAKGKDYQEARTKAVEQYPNYVIYG